MNAENSFKIRDFFDPHCNDTNLDEYEYAMESVKCYAEMWKYRIEIILDKNWSDKCSQKDFYFKRHCITANILHKYDWILFLDADIGVINPKKHIESYIDHNYDLIFYRRFFNWEIMAGSYLAKNSEWTKNFLKNFANFEKNLPNSFHGTDNGAIHAYVIEVFYPDSLIEYNHCHKIWENSKNFGDLAVFEACIKIIMGSSENLGAQNRVKLLRKGNGWCRDGWLTNNEWSAEIDFMLHGWQKKRLIRKNDGKNKSERLKIQSQFASWETPLDLPFDHSKCKDGQENWKWKSEFIIPKEKLYEKLNNTYIKVHEEFLRHLGLIPNFVYSSHFFEE